MSLASAVLILAPLGYVRAQANNATSTQENHQDEPDFDEAVKEGSQELQQDKNAQNDANRIEDGEVQDAGELDEDDNQEDLQEQDINENGTSTNNEIEDKNSQGPDSTNSQGTETND